MAPQDVRSLPGAELPALAARVRERIVGTVAENGGHLAASLGAVELAIGLLRTFSPPEDSILWDVGHQAYAWKILTGRGEAFGSLRRHNGISGFPDPAESPCDAFVAGHAGSALAAALGIAAARDRIGGGHVVAVVGDASLANGESMEALGAMGSSRPTNGAMCGIRGKVLIVVNDNAAEGAWRPGREFFAAFGIGCSDPVDGHNVGAVEAALEAAKREGRSFAVHVVTKKGKGFAPAECDPEAWHGVGPFDLDGTGETCVTSGTAKMTVAWSEVFGEAMVEAARRDGKVCAVVAAMRRGTGLERFAKEFPDRFFDVGIREEMAVTFAAGLAKAGMRPVVAIYSTFLQRAIDQMQHDVCLQRLPVVFAVDRAGCVGEDGATHHGLYDIPLLRPLTGMRILAPCCADDLKEMLFGALAGDGPVAIRYPKGLSVAKAPVEGCWLSANAQPSIQVRLLAVGDQAAKAAEVASLLAKDGIVAEVVPVREVKPADARCMASAGGRAVLVASIENGVVAGGFGESVGADMRFGWPDAVVGHGSVGELEGDFGFDAGSVSRAIAERIRQGNG